MENKPVDKRILLGKLKTYIPTTFMNNLQSKKLALRLALKNNNEEKVLELREQLKNDNEILRILYGKLIILLEAKKNLRNLGSTVIKKTRDELDKIFRDYEKGIKKMNIEYLNSRTSKIIELNEYISTINLANRVIQETNNTMQLVGNTAPNEILNQVSNNLKKLSRTIKKRKSGEGEDILLVQGDSELIQEAINAVLGNNDTLIELISQDPKEKPKEVEPEQLVAAQVESKEIVIPKLETIKPPKVKIPKEDSKVEILNNTKQKEESSVNLNNMYVVLAIILVLGVGFVEGLSLGLKSIINDENILMGSLFSFGALIVLVGAFLLGSNKLKQKN